MLAKRVAPLASLFLSACATTLSTMDTARPTPVGHVRANAAMGIYLPASPISTAMDAGKQALEKLHSNGSVKVTPQEAGDIYEAAVALALMPPSVLQEFMVRTGVLEDMDVGLRVATTALRLDAKYRFFESVDGSTSRHASVGFGVSKYLFKGPVFDTLDFLKDYVKFNDFSRWDFEVPVLYTYEKGEWFTFYAGAKYILSLFSFDQNLFELQRRVSQDASLPPMTEHRRTNMHFFGGVAGAGLGYKYVFVFAELNAGYTYARPSLYSFVDGETRERNLGGATLYPSLGLVLKI